MTAGAAVGPGVFVTLGYALYDEEDELVESSDVSGALEFLFGFGQADQQIERAIDGLPVGGMRAVQLGRECFGRRDPDGVIEVSRDELPDAVAIGDELSAETAAGEPVALRVLELEQDFALLDTSHPLAGQEVRLELTVEALRIASESEIAVAVERISEGNPDLIAPERLLRDPGRR